MVSPHISRKFSINATDDVEEDAPKSQLISRTTVVVGLILSIALSVTFGPLYFCWLDSYLFNFTFHDSCSSVIGYGG